MTDNTKIEWTDATLNVVNGCTVISPGCANCYAMRSGGRNLPGHPSTGLTQPSKAGHVWTGEVRFNEKELLQPLRRRRPRKIFWNAHGDLFHDSVPDEWIDRCFAVMALTPQHIHQVLTKRSARMQKYCNDSRTPGRIARAILDLVIDKLAKVLDTWPVWSVGDIDAPDDVTIAWPLPNVWLGVSVEDQQRADERIPDLLATPAAVRWLSCEPLLGPVDLTRLNFERDEQQAREVYARADDKVTAFTSWWNAFDGQFTACEEEGDAVDLNPHGARHLDYQNGLDWVVVGGESGTGARPMHPDWARSIRDQCVAAGVPFFFKQWGDWMPVEYFEGWNDSFDFRFQDGTSRTLGAVNKNAESLEVDRQEYARVGKKRAGRLLDGVQHDGWPA